MLVREGPDGRRVPHRTGFAVDEVICQDDLVSRFAAFVSDYALGGYPGPVPADVEAASGEDVNVDLEA